MLRMSINWPVARARYEIHVIKISVSPENRKTDFFSNFSQELKVFPNLFPCVYIMDICDSVWHFGSCRDKSRNFTFLTFLQSFFHNLFPSLNK